MERSLGGKWEVLLKIQTFDLLPGRRAVVPRDECQIRNSGSIFYEVSSRTLCEDRLQHAKNTFDFIVVSLDCAGNLLAVPGQSMVCVGSFITLLRPESKTRRRTNPWPKIWNACHWSSRYLSSPTEEILCSGSYSSTKYWMIANDSLCVHPG